MGMARKIISVLYVDEAVAFGGSMMVIGCLVDALDKGRFRPVVVGEMEIDKLKHYIQDDIKTYSIPRMYNYAQWAKTVEIIRKVPVPAVRKIINYFLSFVRALLNSVYLVRLLIVIIKGNIDIVHVNNGMNNLAPILASVLLRRNFIVHFHGIDDPGFIQRMIVSRVPRFIAISEYMKECLVRNGIPENRLYVLPNPVRPEPVLQYDVEHLREQYGITNKDRVLGIVGRIVRWKGHVEFLKAANIVMKAIPDLKLLIVGDYSDGEKAYQDKITRIVEEGDFKDRIIFTGYVKNVGEHYSLMDVCVHASIQPEPFGLVITEAMSYGVPVVASNRGAPREIISDGQDGYLIDPEATNVFADRIIGLLTNNNLRSRIAANGKERVLRDYPLEAYAREMEQIYIDICKE